MPEIDPTVIYQFFVFSPLVHLLEGVLGIGMFVVGLGYLRQVVRDPEILRHSPFWKRVLLLGCVVLFVTYITITYELDLSPLAFDSLKDVKAAMTDVGTEAMAPVLRQTKWLIVTILPIDLLGIALTAALFAVLSIKDLESLLRTECGDEGQEQMSFESFGLFGQIGLLFLITGLWHLVMVGWWLVFSLHGVASVGDWLALWGDPGGRHVYDVLYHLSFGGAHLLYFLLWKRLEGGDWRRARINLLEWWGLAAYAALALTVYTTRLSNYVDRLGAGEGGAQLPIVFVFLPLVVVIPALLALASRQFGRGHQPA